MINNDFKQFIELLNKNSVKYLVVDGYALAFHGYPRYTKDIDFWVWVNEENAKNLVKTLREFGFSSLGLNEDDFLSPECILKSRVQILIL